jgi:hypothetical protein
MTDIQALMEVKEAERHLMRALKMVGMARGSKGYLGPGIAAALESVRAAAGNFDAPKSKPRSWPRLSRAASIRRK